MRLIDQLASEIRHSLRVLRNAPVFTVVAVLSLALGIGANTAIFSIVNAVMLKALPVSDPQRLAQIGLASNGRYARTNFTNPIWESLRDHHGDLFDGAFAFNSTTFDEHAGGESRNLSGVWVSGSYFDVLGVRPWIGRLLTPADDRRGGGPGGPSVVISYAFWHDRYGAASDIVGRTLTLGGQSFTIVGVTPPGFLGVEVGRAFNVAVPLGCEPLIRAKDSFLDETGAWWLQLIARVKADSSMQASQAALQAVQQSVRDAAVAPTAGKEARGRFLKEPFTLTPAATGTSFLRQRYRIALFTLLAVVALVLLIACANLANLFLARASRRQKEFAVRLALGASRPRLVRQLLAESLLIASSGAILGLLLAQWASRLLVLQLTPRTQTAAPVVLDLSLDWRVLAFTLAATIVTALLFGLAPAFRSTDLPAGALMKGGPRSIAGGFHPGWTRFNLEKLLIVTQVALSLVLVFGASLFIRSFTSLATLDPGFASDHVLVVGANIRRLDFPSNRRAAQFDRIADAMRMMPGVRSLSESSIAIINNGGWLDAIEVAGFTPSSDQDKNVHMNGVSPGYFATMGTAIRAGRDFDAHDTLQSPKVALVNEAFAGRFFPGKNPIGERFSHKEYGSMRAVEIIGVVQNSKYENLRDDVPPTAYFATSQDATPGNGMNYVLRANGDPNALVPALARVITGVNKDISFDFKTLDATIDASLTQERMLAMLAGFFGSLALLVAGIGLYGVMWLAMTRRRGEIGIRMALGAEPGAVIRMVLREVVIVTTIGILAGAAIAIVSGRLVTNLLFGLTSTDESTWLLAIALLGSVAALAGYLPARRASRVDPMVPLRGE